jgi:anti-anti-sigma regulatory factor
VVTFQGAADIDALRAASEVLLGELGRRHADNVVFEISGCDVIDLDEFAALRKLVEKVQWLGVPSVLAGLRPGIVAYLVSAGIPTGDIRAALDLEQALLEINGNRRLKPQ